MRNRFYNKRKCKSDWKTCCQFSWGNVWPLLLLTIRKGKNFSPKIQQKLPNMYRVTVQEKLKHTKPGCHQEPFEYLPYEPDKALCIYEHLSEYIDRTKPLQVCSKLLISYIRPHKAVSKDTVACWLKVTLGFSGIDMEKFTAHSYRAASISSNKAAGLNLTKILKTAGWSNAQTFAKYYNKPLESVNYDSKLLERSEIQVKQT